MLRLFYLIHEAALLEEETQVNGVVVIMDFDGLGMTQVYIFVTKKGQQFTTNRFR